MPDLRRPSGRTALAILATLVVAGCGGAAPPASGPPSTAPSAAPSLGQTRTDASGIGQVWVSAGGFRMGTDAADIRRADGGRPTRLGRGRAPEREARPRRHAHEGLLDRHDRGHERGVPGVQGRRRLHDGVLLVARGLDLAQPPDRGRPAEALRGRRPGRPAPLHHVVRGGGVRDLARRPTPDRGRMGVRGAQPAFDGLPVGRRLGSDEGERRRQRRAGSRRDAPDGRVLDRRPGHGRQRDGVGERLARRRTPTRGPTDPTGPAEGTVKVEKGGWWGSNPFVARSAYRHYEDPPTYGDEHIGFRVVSPS